MTQSTTTTVIARYNEDISWIRGRCFVVQKDEHLPNTGLEPASYFWYIIEHYKELEGEYLFLQGDPFPHMKNMLDFGSKLVCNADGSPQHPGLKIHELAKLLKLPILDEYSFQPGCPIRTTAEIIKKRPLAWYKKALKLCNEFENAPWIYERLFGYIFTP